MTNSVNWNTMNTTLGSPNDSYVISTGGGSLNSIYISDKTSSWSDAPSPWITTTSENPYKTLHVAGDAEFEGNITIKGKSLSEQLDKIEERLAILHPNEELEEKWENLRGLRKMYLELEAEIKEKEKMWAILNR